MSRTLRLTLGVIMFAVISAFGLSMAAGASVMTDHKSCTGATGGGWCSYAGFDTIYCSTDQDCEVF